MLSNRWSFALLCLCSPALSVAGVTMGFETQSEEGTKVVQARMEGERLRIDPPGSDSYMAWDGKKKQLAIVRVGAREVIRLDEATLKRVSGQVTSAMAAMRQQLEKLPPDQRAQMQAMMAKAGALEETAPKKPAPWVFKAARTKREVAGQTCEVHLGERGDEKIEICVVPWAKAPFKREDVTALKSLSTFLSQGMAGAFAVPANDFDVHLESYPGFPLETVTPGPPKRTVHIKGIQRGPVDASVFTVPEGFTERALPELGTGAPSEP